MNNTNECAYECIYTGAIAGSAAKKCGLIAGDRIIMINNKKINCPDDWDKAMMNRKDTQVIVAIRNNQFKTFTMKVNKIDPSGKLMN